MRFAMTWDKAKWSIIITVILSFPGYLFWIIGQNIYHDVRYGKEAQVIILRKEISALAPETRPDHLFADDYEKTSIRYFIGTDHGWYRTDRYIYDRAARGPATVYITIRDGDYTITELEQ